MSDKKAKFFCENCGNEVLQNAKFCNYCGKFFSKVRCPSCGFQGEQSIFTKGCPSCGYAVGGSHISHSKNIRQKTRRNPKIKNHSLFSKKNKKEEFDALPFWVYAFVISLLIGLVFAFFAVAKMN